MSVAKMNAFSLLLTGNDVLNTIGVNVIELLKQVGVTGDLLSIDVDEVMACYNASDA